MTRPVDLQQTAEVVGRELRRLRTARGWTRSVMCARLAAATGHQISDQTLATYESGARTLSVVRLAALCVTFGIRLVDFWSIVDRRLFRHMDDDIVHVDVRRVAEIERADLAPVRAWARTQLDGNARLVALTPLAITNLATVCGVDTADVRTALQEVEGAGRG